jgi:exosortase A
MRTIQSSLNLQNWVLLSLFIVGFALTAFFWWETAQHWASIVWNVDSYSHGLIVPFISLFLLWDRRAQLMTVSVGIWPPGAFVILVAALLWRLGSASDVMLFTHIAFVLAINGLVITCFGATFYRSALFPMLFLFLMIPFGESLIPPLQVLTAKLAILPLPLFGIEYRTEGVLVYLQSGVFEVARACAGIKFLFTSVVTAVLLAHLAYRSWKKRLLLMIFAAVLPVIANALRVLITFVLAEFIDVEYAKGVDHLIYGWGFLSVILITLIAVAYRFADSESKAEVQTEGVEHKASVFGAGFVFLVVIFAPLGAASGMYRGEINVWVITAPSSPECRNCGIRLLGRQDRLRPDSAANVIDAGYSIRYRSTDHLLTLQAAIVCRQSGARNIQTARKMMVPEDWKPLTGEVDSTVSIGEWMLKRTPYYRDGLQLDIYTAFRVDGETTNSSWRARSLTAWNKFVQGTSSGSVIVVTGMPTKTDAERLRDQEKVETFLSTFPADRFLWSVSDGEAQGEQNKCVV